MRILRKPAASRDGCGYLITTCFFTCVFLLINGRLAYVFYHWLAPRGPELMLHPRFTQFALFVTPVLMLVVEWYLADVFVQRLSHPRGGK